MEKRVSFSHNGSKNTEIIIKITLKIAINRSVKGFPGGSVVKNSPANAGDVGLILGLGRSPGVGNGNRL